MEGVLAFGPHVPIDGVQDIWRHQLDPLGPPHHHQYRLMSGITHVRCVPTCEYLRTLYFYLCYSVVVVIATIGYQYVPTYPAYNR